jgi:uncharacterized protein YbaA (DUF1428 family)
MSRYIDGFVIPIPTSRIDEYRLMAEQAAIIWKEHGALDYWECVDDDMDIKDVMPFTQLANIKPNETVIFAWLVFKSKEPRGDANAAIFVDPLMQAIIYTSNPIFDSKRMAYGGFR